MRLLLIVPLLSFCLFGCVTAFDSEVEESIMKWAQFRVNTGKNSPCKHIIIEKLDDDSWSVNSCKQYALCRNRNRAGNVDIECEWDDKRILK